MGLIALVVVLVIVAAVVAGAWRRIPVRTQGQTGIEPPDA